MPEVLSAAQAHELGISRHGIAHRLESGRWQRLLHGVYLTHSGSASESSWLRAAVLWGGAESMISGSAGLRRYKVPTARPAGILVLVPRERRARSALPVIIRRTPNLPRKPRILTGIATAPVGRCLVDACRGLKQLNDVRGTLAAAVQGGWCSVADVRDELDCAGRRGTALLRTALAEVGAGAESVAECAAAQVMIAAGLPAFEQNSEVFDMSGIFLARADFLWRELRAILEIDGRAWHLSPAAWERTLKRHSALEVAGYSVLHYSPSAIAADPDRFISDVVRWLDSRRLLLGA